MVARLRDEGSEPIMEAESSSRVETATVDLAHSLGMTREEYAIILKSEEKDVVHQIVGCRLAAFAAGHAPWW